MVRRADLGIGFQLHALPLLGHPITSPLLWVPMTLLWIWLLTHAFNLIEGLDGLSGGLAFIAGLTLRECLQNRQLGLKPVGFVDDDLVKVGKNFNGYPVLGTGEEIPVLVDKHHIDTLLISSPEIPPGRVAWLQEVLEAMGVELQRCRIVLETVMGDGEGERREGWEGGNGERGEVTPVSRFTRER